ncbi:uncharacterized protein LOC101578038 [Octodon degus]|uniref:Uncharacterized protein LOC101578038 n=1 Tax=Octodon degus TaxID=10160 RepID=A0A6P3EWT1_OCTDE|nr:uncharacterized protein LOC101578038 [Octodon degus]
MRRKRRKAYKKWKILNAAGGTSQPSGHACQRNVKDVKKEVEGDTSEAVFHQTGALGKSKENGSKQMSNSVNEKQNSSLLPKAEKQSPSDNNAHREKESDDPPSAISHQLKKVLPVVVFHDCGESLSEKITLHDFPGTVEGLKPEKGKFITEVKCEAFHVQVEIKKNIFCKTGTRFSTKRCRACRRLFPARHVGKCCTAKRCFPKHNDKLAEQLKSEVPSKYEREVTRTESPSLKVSIVGKEIKVKYGNKKQNLSINITHPKRRGKINKYRNLSSNHTTEEELSRSPSHSSVKHAGKKIREEKQQNAQSGHVSPPDALTVWKENSSIAVASLTSDLKREKSKANSLSSGSNASQGESAVPQHSVFRLRQLSPDRSQFSAADTVHINIGSASCDSLPTTSSSNTDVSKLSFEDPKDGDRERKTKCDVSGTITAESNIKQITEGNPLLGTVTDVAPVQEGSEPGFCSLPPQTRQHSGEKAVNAECKGSRTPPAEDHEVSHVPSFSSSQSGLKPSTSSSPSHWAARHSETRENPEYTFSFNHCAKFVTDHEKDDGDVTDGDIGKVILHGDYCENTQQFVERKHEQSPSSSPVSCSSLDAGDLHQSINHRSEIMDQLEVQGHHPEKTLSQTKGPAMISLTDGSERKFIAHNDKEGPVDSNCPLGMRTPEESLGSVGQDEHNKLQLIPVLKNACHRDSEDLSRGTHNQVCFQMDLPLNTADDELFLIEKMLPRGADRYSNHDAKPIIPPSSPQEPEKYQKVATRKSNSEGGEHKYSCYHPTGMLLSPQKQRDFARYDQNVEILSLRKLSQELALRGGRASDSSQEDAIDQWARRRQQLRDGRRCNSAGGSSFTSNLTEGSITSDDGPFMDFGFRVDIEEKGFYTENFHSAAWVFRGDDGDPEDSPRCLSKKPRPVAVRERTVRLFKGTGDCPWGFRIQFSKPIMVTEVDANSAAEEAGLQIGDVVLSVNGTEVTSVEHAEAVHLARKGPDILTLVVGSDISRCPNTPWPTCRGYLHKRTHSGFVKGWRKRWFVLKHDGCLQYHKHKKDEGKLPPLETVKLEGAEVSIDSSLGKPFVFNCTPQSGNRIFCLCATSNQEMKRWLEAMDRAAHPTHQSHVWEDITLHNSSLPPLAIKNPECLGLLHQLDRSMDSWVQHYCILKDGCLYFYASIRSTQALGGLYLQGYRVSEQIHSFKESVIELKPSSEEFKTFYFCADNKTENQRWITALKTSIKKWLPLHQAIQDFMNRPLEETKM